MPVPTPNNGESESDFISRCISFLVNEGTDQEEAVAICSTQWENKIMKVPYNKSDYADKKDLIDFLVKNKGSIIAQKKAIFKRADGIGLSSIVPMQKTANKAFKTTDTEDELQRTLIINTTKVLDSYDDVHFDGLWRKSLQENSDLMHLQEHEMRFANIIADGPELKAYTKTFSFVELGYAYEGKTQALVFESKIRKDRNAYMFEQYSKGRVKNHSVGMRYVKVLLAVNDSRYTEEKDAWDKYFPKILVGKEQAEAQGFFFAVLEAKAIEGSAVPKGANPLTPTHEIKSEEPHGSTHGDDDTIEPPKGTLSYEKMKFFI